MCLQAFTAVPFLLCRIQLIHVKELSKLITYQQVSTRWRNLTELNELHFWGHYIHNHFESFRVQDSNT